MSPGQILQVKSGHENLTPRQAEPPDEPASVLSEIWKQKVAYCTKLLEVSGTLAYTPYFLMFDPELDEGLATVKSGRAVERVPAEQCQCCVSMSDVSQCTSIRLPAKKVGSPLQHLVQITLSPGISSERDIHGTAQFSFRIKSPDKDNKLTTVEKQEKAREVAQRMNELRKRAGEGREGDTLLPYYDVVLSSSESEDGNTQDDLGESLTPTLSDSQSSLPDLYPPFPSKSSPPSLLLSKSMQRRLTSELPKLYQLRQWHLVYSPSEHGCSFRTLYRNASGFGASILVVQDESKRIFGGFISEPLHVSKDFYGTGEGFLFTFKRKNCLKLYKATFLNEFYVSSDEDAIFLGSGGEPGLYISEDLIHGGSGCSDTYGNEVLSATDSFSILNIEIWGFIYPRTQNSS